MDIEQFKHYIVKLANEKGWANDYPWLCLGVFKEMGEIIQAIEHNESEEKIGLEFADLMHFLLQLMNDKAPTVNLDMILKQKILDNKTTKKKTFEGGKIVRK